jgi:hypothetical protein
LDEGAGPTSYDETSGPPILVAREGTTVSETGLSKEQPSQSAYQRKDKWWVEPALVFLGFSAFVVYSTWAAFQTKNFYYLENGAHYLSPFYSPCLAASCGPLTFGGTPLFSSWAWSPALLILAAPLGFRFTCYYYRKAYYRAFWQDPAGCAIPERKAGYRGENAFPLILQNVHRYFLWVALLVLVFLWYDAMLAFRFTDPVTHEYGFGVSFMGLFFVLNSTLLTIYTFSCHSLRHIIGGADDCFSCTVVGKTKKAAWRGVTLLNERHMMWAWLSLFSVGLSDVLVRLAATGVMPEALLIPFVRF